MQIAIVENGVVVRSGEHTELFPYISFPVTGIEPEWMIVNNVHAVNHFIPYDNETQKLVPAELYIENDEVYAVRVEALTTEELDARLQQLANQVRAQRNTLLAQSDWTALTDTVLPEDVKLEYEVYRQALRDITLQEGFPKAVIWPVLNSGVDLLSTSMMGSGSVI